MSLREVHDPMHLVADVEYSASCRAGPSRGRASQGVESGSEQTELIAFGVGQDMPLLIAALTDVSRPGAERQQSREFGILVAIGGVDVQVQS